MMMGGRLKSHERSPTKVSTTHQAQCPCPSCLSFCLMLTGYTASDSRVTGTNTPYQRPAAATHGNVQLVALSACNLVRPTSPHLSLSLSCSSTPRTALSFICPVGWVVVLQAQSPNPAATHRPCPPQHTTTTPGIVPSSIAEEATSATRGKLGTVVARWRGRRQRLVPPW